MRDALSPGFTDIQAWLAAVLLSRSDLPKEPQRARDATGLTAEQLANSGEGASIQRRLDGYASGYVLRLMECLKVQYPILHANLGETVFQAFAKAFIVEEPPSHWDLDALGAGFAAFLARTRPHGTNDPEVQALLDLPLEIAAFERALGEAEIAAAPAPRIPADFMLALLPADARLRLQAGASLLALRAETLQRLAEHGHPHLAARPGDSAVLVSCAANQARAVRLDPWQEAFLKACDGRNTLVEAAHQASRQSGVGESDVLARLTLWLPLVMTALDTAGNGDEVSPPG
jgi:hypothetical protein